MTIEEFIEARLAADEAAAKAAAEQDNEGESWRVRKVRDDGMFVWGEHQAIPPNGKGERLGLLDDAQTRFIESHDPALVLRQVERDRKVLNRHRLEQLPPGMLMIGNGGSGDTCAGCGVRNGSRAWPCVEVRDLAAIWSGHPDYRQEWSA